jgi:hypothetical protein
MSYTLKMQSTQFPVSVHHPELANEVWKSAVELSSNGWSTEIVDIPTHVTDGHTYGPYQQIKISRKITYLDQLKNFWGTKLIGIEAERIGVVFDDANIYYRNRQRESGICATRNHTNDSLWWNWDCSILDVVEIFVNGGWQWGEENLNKFSALLSVWEAKFRIARKIKQLIGAAVTQNQGAIDRLREEILEQVATL